MENLKLGRKKYAPLLKLYKMSGILVAREIDFGTSLSQNAMVYTRVHSCYIAQNCSDVCSLLWNHREKFDCPQAPLCHDFSSLPLKYPCDN